MGLRVQNAKQTILDVAYHFQLPSKSSCWMGTHASWGPIASQAVPWTKVVLPSTSANMAGVQEVVLLLSDPCTAQRQET